MERLRERGANDDVTDELAYRIRGAKPIEVPSPTRGHMPGLGSFELGPFRSAKTGTELARESRLRAKGAQLDQLQPRTCRGRAEARDALKAS